MLGASRAADGRAMEDSTMSKYCNCCGTDEDYIQTHLRWNVVDAHGHETVADFTDEDWLREAIACKDCWASAGEPLSIGDDELAELLKTVYGEL
jgi:hypothetical protein